MTSESAPFVNAVESSDYTAQLDLTGLPAGQRIFYEVRFQELGDLATTSEPVIGSFRTAPSTQGNVRFLWSGDPHLQGLFTLDLAATWRPIPQVALSFIARDLSGPGYDAPCVATMMVTPPCSVPRSFLLALAVRPEGSRALAIAFGP